VTDLSAALLASLPANAIRIPAEVTKQRVQVRPSVRRPMSDAIVTKPSGDEAKTSFSHPHSSSTCQAGIEKRALSAARTIVAEEGVGGLYVGGLAQLARELPFNAVQFVAFQNMKELLLVHGLATGIAAKVRLRRGYEGRHPTPGRGFDARIYDDPIQPAKHTRTSQLGSPS
jgi:hypothetical protein